MRYTFSLSIDAFEQLHNYVQTYLINNTYAVTKRNSKVHVVQKCATPD